MATGDLRAAIEYASQNPKSDFANQLNQRISSGQADGEAQKLGIDLTPIKQYAAKQNPVVAPIQTTKTALPSFAQSVSSDIKTRYANVQADIAGTSPESQGEPAVVRGLQAASEGAGGVLDVAGDAVKSVFPNAPKDLQRDTNGDLINPDGTKANVIDWGKVGSAITNSPEFAALGPAAITSLIGKQAFDAIQANPAAYKALTSTLKGLSAGGNIANTILGADGVLQTVADKAPGVVSSIADTASDAKSALGNKVKTIISGTPDAQATAQTAQELANIKENISPTLSAKESKIAQSQGRIYAGKDATLLKAETPDQVATSDTTARQIFTIHENIPNAGSMNASDLHEALGNKVNEITNTLRPQLDATPLHPDAMEKLNNDWQKIQKEQMTNAPADQEANLAKRQQKFDSFLQKTKQGNPSDVIAEIRAEGSTLTPKEAAQKIQEASKPPTLGDLWDTAIKYDNSIPDVVKSAKPPLASESLLQQRAEWIQNRAILKNAINDSTTGLGATSQKAFQDMSDMLDAKSNIIKNTEAVKSQKLNPSKLKQAYDSPKGKIVRGVVKAGVGIEAGKKLLGL